MPNDEKIATLKILEQNGYEWSQNGIDLVAVDPSISRVSRRLMVYSDINWALGAIHHSVCDHLARAGYDAQLKAWSQAYSIRQFHAEVEQYDYVITLPYAGTKPLVESYQVPREKIIIVAHLEEDLIRMLRHEGGAAAFDRYAGYAVMSDSLACSSLTLGITRVPYVVRLGIEFDHYCRQPPAGLNAVGYGTAMVRQNEYGLDFKRGWLAKETAELAGLEFSAVANLPFSKMPDFYETVGAVLMPSLQEGAGLPPLEAAAAGRLVIGTPVGHFPRLAYEGMGILAPLEANAFRRFAVERLKYFVANPTAYHDKCSSIQQAAKRRDWSIVIEDWKELIAGAR